jgi:hypothetical protein
LPRQNWPDQFQKSVQFGHQWVFDKNFGQASPPEVVASLVQVLLYLEFVCLGLALLVIWGISGQNRPDRFPLVCERLSPRDPSDWFEKPA